MLEDFGGAQSLAGWVHSVRAWERSRFEPVGEAVVGKEEGDGAIGRR